MNKDSVPTAKEYFYTCIAPEERGKNYSSMYHSNLFNEDKHFSMLGMPSVASMDQKTRREILGFEPSLSNDSLLEDELNKIISIVNDELAEKIKETFVVKRNSKDAHAEALAKQERYTGNIVFYYVGLSDACLEYSILFSKLVKMQSNLAAMEDSPSRIGRLFKSIKKTQDKKLLELKSKIIFDFVVSVIRLVLSQEEWIVEGNYIQYNPILISPGEGLDAAAVNTAVFTDRFIMCHEIAHHLLGHTGNQLSSNSFVDRLFGSNPFDQSPNNHQREYQADILAILMISGATKPGDFADLDRDKSTLLADSAIGSLITLAVIGHASGDMNASTLAHPSAQERYKNVVRIIKSLPYNDVALSVIWRVNMLVEILNIVRRNRHIYTETFMLFSMETPQDKSPEHLQDHVLEAIKGMSELIKQISEVLERE